MHGAVDRAEAAGGDAGDDRVGIEVREPGGGELAERITAELAALQVANDRLAVRRLQAIARQRLDGGVLRTGLSLNILHDVVRPGRAGSNARAPRSLTASWGRAKLRLKPRLNALDSSAGASPSRV